MSLEIGGATRTLSLNRVKALAAVAVDDAAEPNLLLDLLMEPPVGGGGVVKLLRVETHCFDPRRLVPTESEPEDAFLSLAGAVLSASGASWLLGEGAHQLRRYASVPAYERDLLTVLRLGGL
ncbi:MAG: hypothetical protein IH608_03920 [Proteobacteria bacterium]|nr:hypothetical protein [Pseudomonadota bacterium]